MRLSTLHFTLAFFLMMHTIESTAVTRGAPTVDVCDECQNYCLRRRMCLGELRVCRRRS